MATKINPDFYGAENTFITLTSGNVKTAPHNLNWYGNNSVYTGGDWDTTAAPWGIGRCSLSSNMIQVPTIGQEWTINQHENTKANNPLFMYHNVNNCYGSFGLADFTGASATWQNYARTLFKCRYSPDAHTSGNSVISDLSIDDGEYITIADCYDNYPIAYADYSKLRLAIRNIQYKPTNSDTMKRVDGIPALIAADDVDKVTKITFDIYNPDRSQCGFYTSIGGVGLSMPDIFKTRYYGDVDKYVRPWRYNADIGHWDGSSTTEFARATTNDHFSYSTAWETLSASDDVIATYPSIVGYAMSSISRYQQNFDDVSYHWEYGICPYMGAGHNFDIAPIQTGDTYTSGIVQTFAYMELDDYADNLTKTQAYIRAILHEVAFMGFAIIGDIFDSAENIGSNKVYLPVFDEHLVTTGEYKNGSASLELPNATWGDIFGTTMPDYDPDYDPDAPPSPDDDYGYLDNKPITNRVYSSNNRVYALTAEQYSQFINDVNSLYLDDPDTGYANFQLDFKGTNPSDYIVGTYGYTFLPAGLIPNQQPEAIQIGAVTLPNAEGYKIAPSYIYNYRSLGEIDLTGAGDFKPFGDFRDFEPYTHIELYIPLCGNIELDPATVIGHTIQIDIIFDIMTGNATACIYRDNKTLIATVAGQLAASLPLTSGRMGDYQNAVKSAENALKQNELKTTTAAASVAIGVGAALLAPETGGLSLAAYGAAMTGGASLMSLSNQKEQIEYEIKHKQPSISVCSSANGAVAQNISSMYAVCYVKQCKMLSSYNAATYAHTVGHATVKNTTIGAETTDDSNSLIVCSNADLSGIPATAAEINAIQSLLTGGVYV